MTRISEIRRVNCQQGEAVTMISEKSVNLTAKPLTTLSGHEGEIWNMIYLPGGERIVTCSVDKTVRIWDVENGEQEGTTMEHGGRVYGLAITRDGKKVLSGGKDNRIRVWDVETHELIEEWEKETGNIWSITVSPDDQLAASGGEQGDIVIREIQEGGRIRHSIKAGSGVPSICFSPNGEKLGCAVGNITHSVIHVYDVESGELVLGPISGHENIINCVLWSLDGKPWTGHIQWVWSLSLSLDGTKLASASWDKTVRFWDARSGDPIGQPLQHDDDVYAVTFSPSGEFVASGGKDKKVFIWRVPWWDDSQKQLPAIPAPKDWHQGELDFLDLPTSRRPFISSRPPVNSTPAPIATRVQRFWRGLFARGSSSSPAQQAIELQPIPDRRFWKSPARPALTEVAAARAKKGVAVGRRERRKKKRHQEAQAPTGSSTAEA
ncbi:WD40 repeat-like protein, partial [Paxillus ammoniavirescens]